MSSNSPQLARVLALPDAPEGAAPGPKVAQLEGRLWPIQVAALAELEAAPAPRGIFCPIGAGYGKTRISLLAGWVLGIERWLLIVPAALVKKTYRDLGALMPVFPELSGFEPEIVSAETVSSKKSSTFFDKRQPRLIVIDEAHHFANTKSARAKRLERYVTSNPDTRVVALSGTLDQGGISRMELLAELCLREGSFLPTEPSVLSMWASVLDKGSVPPNEYLKMMAPLVEWALDREDSPKFSSAQDKVRWAFKVRKARTPGVVATADVAIPCSLEISYWNTKKAPGISAALDRLRESWELPDGSMLVDSLEYHRHARTLALGFYTVVDYGDSPEEWLDARLEWGRAITRQLEYIKGWPHLDSRGRVADAAEAGTAHPDVCAAWRRWAAVRDDVTPKSEVVWLDRSVVAAAAHHVAQAGRGLVWYSSLAVGAELGKYMPVYGAGDDEPPANVQVAALSIQSHGTGKNLQAWDYQLVLQPPVNALVWEQLLARTHRRGQRSDSVSAEINTTYWPLKSAVYSAINGAAYEESMGTQKQRLLYATWR